MCTFLFYGGIMNNKFFNLAFSQAEKAFINNEVPIGAVIVKNGEVISLGYNRKEEMHNCTAHAEIIAISEASKILNNWRLDGCEIYVTLDPCPMCASAIKQARISTIYSALSNSDENNSKIISEILKNDKVNSAVEFKSGYFPDKSRKLLNDFFEKQRNI